MDSKAKIKISREGVNVGEYQLWQIAILVRIGKILVTDHYWHEGMKEWKKLSDSEIIKESVEAKNKMDKLESSKVAQDNIFESSKALYMFLVSSLNTLFITVIFIIGFYMFMSGVFGNPEGSAIRQAVLEQRTTNGLLMMILGTLIHKFQPPKNK